MPAPTARRCNTSCCRSVDAAGNELANTGIKNNRFGVGDIIACTGSSSAWTWFQSSSGSGKVPLHDSISIVNNPGSSDRAWGLFGTAGAAVDMANYISQQTGVPVAMMPFGIVGETLGNWNDTSGAAGKPWTGFLGGLGFVGGKLGGVFFTAGSNDAKNPGWITSTTSHLNNIHAHFTNVRNATGQPSLAFLLSGYNGRSDGTLPSQDIQSDYVRMAENIAGDDPGVYHVMALDYPVGGDNIHLTNEGFAADCIRNQQVWIAARKSTNGTYPRGPKIVAMTYNAAAVTVTVVHRNGTDLSTPVDYAGFTITDSDPSGVAPVILSVVRLSATQLRITCDRPLVNPVVKYMSGRRPDITKTVYDNGTMALPMHVEIEMAVTYQATAPATDTTNPVMSGAATATATWNSATVTIPAATDNVTVAGYEYSLNNGSTWTPTNSTATSFTLNGLSAVTPYSGLARAIDTSGNRSNTVPFSFTTAAAPDTTAPTLSSPTAVSTGTTTASGSVTTSEAGGMLYRLVSRNAAESAATVKAGQSSTVAAAGAQAVSFTGLTAGTAYYGHFLHRDAAGNESAVANTAAFTTSAESPANVSNFTPSSSRTLKVLAGHGFSAEGAFWDMANPDKPVGTMDSSAVLDIVLDWTGYLADIGSPAIGNATITVAGVQNTSPLGRGNLTILFASAVAGAAGAMITFKIWTATTPQVIDERTVYLKFEDK
jgi:hypothetical protein